MIQVNHAGHAGLGRGVEHVHDHHRLPLHQGHVVEEKYCVNFKSNQHNTIYAYLGA